MNVDPVLFAWTNDILCLDCVRNPLDIDVCVCVCVYLDRPVGDEGGVATAILRTRLLPEEKRKENSGHHSRHSFRVNREGFQPHI